MNVAAALVQENTRVPESRPTLPSIEGWSCYTKNNERQPRWTRALGRDRGKGTTDNQSLYIPTLLLKIKDQQKENREDSQALL